ncbi:MAG: hypothetical protein QOJ02_3533 [Acidobacteriota bacterium]|jgi:hypothetical protein|nr:hypothetical protein [Acidobacteriota bacterium]
MKIFNLERQPLTLICESDLLPVNKPLVKATGKLNALLSATHSITFWLARCRATKAGLAPANHRVE